MLLLLCIPFTLITLFTNTAHSTPPPQCPKTPYSTRMADSVISRGEAIAPLAHEPKSSIYLRVGFFQTALLRALGHYGSSEDACAGSDWRGYLQESAESVIPWLENKSQDMELPLDRFSTGWGLLNEYTATQNATAKDTLDTLRQSVGIQPQNQYGGYWYFKYPNWSYLDGMYSLVPFMTYYTQHFDSANAPAVTDDIIHQLDLFWTHCRQNTTGLLVHGYDASKKASWAYPVTGASPFAWSRSLGWYFMALVDTLELVRSMPGVFPKKLERYLDARFVELTKAVVAAADAKTGCWYQVMEYPGREGNYIESSGSAMFTYVLYKGARLGYSSAGSEQEYIDLAEKCYGYLVGAFVNEDPKNGTLAYNGTVGVCSLDSSASYEYYISQPLLYNSVHGTAAFILASLEHEIFSKKP